MNQIEFQIPEGYVLDKEASTDSKLVYKKQSSFPKTWEEFCEAVKSPDYYYIDENSKICKKKLNGSMDFQKDRNKVFTKARAESLLALTQLLNLRDEYSRHDCADDYNPYYYSIVYCENISNLKILKTGHQTLFSFFREDLAQKFLENCRTLLHRVLGMIPYYD